MFGALCQKDTRIHCTPKASPLNGRAPSTRSLSKLSSRAALVPPSRNTLFAKEALPNDAPFPFEQPIRSDRHHTVAGFAASKPGGL